MLILIKKFFKILNSDISPVQISFGFGLGSIIGLTPFWSLHNMVIWLLIFLLRVNIGGALLGVAVFSIIGFFLDPFADMLGYRILAEAESLHAFWTALYNMPILPFTRFNNTVVMGSLLISIILFIPVVFGMRRFIIAYRSHMRQRLEKVKFFQLLKASKIFQWYQKLRG